VPLAGLPLPTAFAVFTLLSLVLLGWGAYRAAWGGPATRMLAAVLLISAWPTVMAAVRGQSTIAVAGLLALSASALGSGAAPAGPTRAGIGAGLSALKPTLSPLWLAWLAVTRRWRALLLAALVIAALVLLAALVVSPRAVFDYPGYLFGSVADASAIGVHPEQMMNWRGVAARLGLDGVVVSGAGTLLTLGLLGAAWWWSRCSPRSGAIGAAAALAATPLVISHANQHEAILVGLAVLLTIGAFEELRPALVRAAIGLHSVLWLGPVFPGEASGWALFGAALGWLVLLVMLARSERDRAVPVREVPART
jgi:alpha-1,2-mannosyltransferase